eukprot:TRINITY_DN1688_c0_g1_i1.p1 TRINITY_DN1688_c0_g1~~TRINITY_DN1688_c0_g1_i1.p1  ORF type:complete len:621 (+),score=209.83 TRINITY_DN1688_c0_g1_i1:113-1975(+)
MSQDFRDLSFGLTNPPSFGSAGDLWKDLPDDVLKGFHEPLTGSSGPYQPVFDSSGAELILANPGISSWSPSPSQEPTEPAAKIPRLGDSSTPPDRDVGSQPASGVVSAETVPTPTGAEVDLTTPDPDPAPLLVKTESIGLSTFQFDGSFGTLVFPELYTSRGELAVDFASSQPAEPDATSLLAELQGYANDQDRELEAIAASAVDSRPDAHGRPQLLLQQITQQTQELFDVRSKFVLTVGNLAAAERLAQQFSVQRQRADVIRSELAPGERKPYFALLIVQQPPTQVVFKGRPVDAPYRVRLLAGPLHPELAADTVKASIADEDNWKSAKPLENDVAKVARDRTAEFPDLKLHVSTRMTAIHVRFSCVSKDKKTPIAACSLLSNPMIVITNESQWADAEGKLLLLEAFSGQNEIPWPQYANMLHRHVLYATSQDVLKTNKCLSVAELNYIHARYFDNQPKIRKAKASEFWGWFGQVLTTIRFKRHIKALWSDGWIYGIASKEEAKILLCEHRPGTFLIRFSDSVPGSFAVAYTCDDGSADGVRHYLIKPEEISNNKSLPDFMRDKTMFKYIMQYPLRSSERPESLVVAEKDTILGQFYSKRKTAEPEAHGYQQNLHGGME